MTTARLAKPRSTPTTPLPILAPPPAAVRPRPELAALRIAYSDLATIAVSLEEADSWLPTRCTGWLVRDLLVHLLGDVRRALVALATPAAGPPDRDAVSWWTRTGPAGEPELSGIRRLRAMAGVWDLDDLVRTLGETTRAVLALAGRTPPGDLVVSHGHVLCVDDLLSTLAVRAAVHHLDLVQELRRPGPRPEPLALVRRTLDALLGQPSPAEWSDERWALLGTGRVRPGGGERRVLGAAAARLPLLG